MKAFAYIALLLGLATPFAAFAFTATSTSFFVKQNVDAIAGGSPTTSESSSASFSLFAAGGQTANGTSTPGTNFTLWGGFLRSFDKDVHPNYTQLHFHWRNDDGTEATATSGTGGVQDTATSSIPKSVVKRLRIGMSNEGGTQAAYTTEQFQLEYGEKVSTCDAIASWTDVGAVAGHWDMANTANLTNGDGTTNIATAVGGVTDENKYFVGQGAVLDTASAPSALLLPSHSFIEIEYAIQALSGATDSGTYCFRVTDAGTATQYTYTRYAEATLAVGAGSRPTASAAAIDAGAVSVTLTENTTHNVVCTGTVTDTDGFADITAVGAYFFRTTVGTTSAADDNNQYRLYGDSQCVPSSGAGNSEDYTCTFAVQYFADPTDAGSPNASDNWSCELWPADNVATGTVSVDTVEMSSLIALDVTASIAYGSVNANTDTGVTNQTTTLTNTGNRDMDPELSGAAMTDGGSGTIAASQQKYDATAFTYSSGGTALSGTPATFDITLPQRTAGAVTDDILWGLGVPNGTPNGSYTGSNTITAVAGI
ncbi:MAG: hypothetical protein KBE09_02615 [Candidatus Pacebacteria bacterium]|nr:hypothetical protein [Candidatus Paceibacterota bacterium]